MKYLLTFLLGGAVVGAYFTKPEMAQHQADYPVAVEKSASDVFGRAQAELQIRDAEYVDYFLFSMTRSANSIELIGAEKGDVLSIGVFDTIFVAH